MTAGSLVKATLTSTEQGVAAINFQFNPTSLEFARSVDWEETDVITSTGFPKLNYKKRQPATLKLSGLVFDTYEYDKPTSVLTLIKPILDSTKATIKIPSGFRPPIYLFSWGQNEEYFSCFVTNITYNLTMFLRDGMPVRAIVGIDLKEQSIIPPPPGPPPR